MTGCYLLLKCTQARIKGDDGTQQKVPNGQASYTLHLDSFCYYSDVFCSRIRIVEKIATVIVLLSV